MNYVYLKNTTALFISIIAVNCQASLISYDLLTPTSSLDINYNNPLSDAFSSHDDAFQIYQRGANAPDALLDKSTHMASDSLGIITTTNTQAFFGIVDTVNSDNPSNYAIANWQLNITNLSTITFFIDIAAMGDFENSDEFIWRYSIDSNPFHTIFQGISDEDTIQNYRLADNSLVALNDPMTVNSQLLSNEFKTFSSEIVSTGNLLTLELAAKTNGGNEAIAFQNVLIHGLSSTVTVTEPKSFTMLLLAIMLFFAKRQVRT